jgi:hypothetical protein
MLVCMAPLRLSGRPCLTALPSCLVVRAELSYELIMVVAS